MKESSVYELDPIEIYFMEYNAMIVMAGLLALIMTVIYSFKSGGIKEVTENAFLWFLLFGGIFYVSSYPVQQEDQITGGLFFVAFGVCRLAKQIVKNKDYR